MFLGVEQAFVGADYTSVNASSTPAGQSNDTAFSKSM
jgi:hypothetical protein